MKSILTKSAKYFAEKVYSVFGKSSGGMLLATSILGLTLSAGAQIIGICFNKKYTTSQKAFMIPQELGELFVASLAIFAITKPAQKLASKLVKTGKIASEELLSYMRDNNLLERRGNLDFDFGKEIIEKIKTIKKSEEFKNLSRKDRKTLIEPYKNALDSYNINSDVVSAYATTGASMITTGFAVPVLRNRFASYYQKRNIEAYNYYSSQKTNGDVKI